ncbi:MAG: tryptophan synthase subunit alpha [Lentisphaeraceae bacterium]|nr:tryptophan synthase subunit alpha [Lentisphaeraceae bacterium]
MSTTLEKYVREKLEKKEILLMTHVICGYPSFEDNYKELKIMAEAGVDLVELQFPFSEPSADGPLFVKANQISLENGTTVDQCFDFLEKISKEFPFKTMMMGYYNTAYKLGEEKYIERLKAAGAFGFILPDLPIEEAGPLHTFAEENDQAPIMLMTPTNTQERLNSIGSNAEGLVYAVARKGVTGKKTAMDDEVGEFLLRCREATDLPLGVGFGLSCKDDLDYLKGKADIAIIGTAALRAWEEGQEEGLRTFFKNLTA